MSNLARIELFLHKMCKMKGRDTLDPEEPAMIKMQGLMESLKIMERYVGDEKINDMFKSILTSLVIETVEGPIKNSYMEVLAEFNRSLNSQLN